MPIGLKDINAAVMLLAETYPLCFTAEQYLPHRPLKIGIDRDLAECCPALDRRERGLALQFYTSRLVYLQSLVEGADRVDLDGNPVSTVTARDVEHARSRITEIMAARAAEAAAAKAVSKAAKTLGKVVRPTAPIVPPTPEPLPTTSPAPTNSVVKLKDRPLLTLPAFKRKVVP